MDNLRLLLFPRHSVDRTLTQWKEDFLTKYITAAVLFMALPEFRRLPHENDAPKLAIPAKTKIIQGIAAQCCGSEKIRRYFYQALQKIFSFFSK